MFKLFKRKSHISEKPNTVQGNAVLNGEPPMKTFVRSDEKRYWKQGKITASKWVIPSEGFGRLTVIVKG